MENKEQEGSAEPRTRYVWDHNKLAWVETVEEPTVEEVPVEKPMEQTSAEIAEEANLVEAVEEAEWLEYRGPFSRGVAIIIDVILLFIVHSILAVAFGTETAVEGTEETIKMLPQWMLFVMGFIYFVGFWTWRGQTPGKLLLGAKVVKLDGSPVGLGRSVLRYIVFMVYGTIIGFFADITYVAVLLILIAFMVIVLNRRKRGIHDLVAGTCVINSRPSTPMVYTAEEELGEAEQGSDASEQT